MKKIIFFCFALSSIVSFSQDSNFWGNVRLGGTFGLSLGSNSTSVAVSPSAIYDFNEEFSIGASIGYLYNKSKSYSANVYSASVITLYRPIRTIEFSGELIQSYVNRTIGIIKDNYSYPSLNLGAAYVTGKIAFGVQYDVLHKEDKSIYSNPLSPFVRVFF